MSLYSVLRKIAYPFIKVLYPTKFIGKDNIPDGKAVVLSNHYSMAEIPVICVGLFKKNFNGLSKKELYENKFIGWFLKKLGGIPVDREGNDIGAIRTCISKLSKGEKLFICPEGTRNKNKDYKKILPLKSGSSVIAIKTKTPIVIVLINKKPKLFRKNYIMISEPIELTEFYTDRSPDMKERATEYITDLFEKMREKMEHYLSLSKKERKIYENNGCK